MFIDIVRHDDWTTEQYHAHDAFSNSGARTMAGDPYKFRQEELGAWKRPETRSMKMGKAFDELLLTPSLFRDNWTVVPDGDSPTTAQQSEFCKAILSGCDPEEAHAHNFKRTSKEQGLEMYANFTSYFALKDAHALSVDDKEVLDKMIESVGRHDRAAEIVRTAQTQVCFTGTHAETGVKVKGMIDCLLQDEEVDVKWTEKPWDRINKWWLKDGFFHTQRAMYHGLAPRDRQSVLVVSAKGRYRTKLFDVTEFLEEATMRLNSLIKQYDWRVKNNAWDHGIAYYKFGGYEFL